MGKPDDSVRKRREDATIRRAIRILEGRLRVTHGTLDSPSAVRDLLRLRLVDREFEIFAALFLDRQHRLIAYEELFRGTLSQTSVYPREIVKTALFYNAGSVVFVHNHPSGVAEPSRTDEVLTATLIQALLVIDVTVMDHFVVAGHDIVSFVERGLL